MGSSMKDTDSTTIKLICGFVDKSGGYDKVKAAAESLMKIPKDEYGDFLIRLSKRPGGAQELIAAAISGFVLSAMVYHDVKNLGVVRELSVDPKVPESESKL